MTMLAASDLERPEEGLFNASEDFHGLIDELYADQLLCSDTDIFGFGFGERTELCNSVSSSTCPSPASELSTFDNGLDDSLDVFLFDRTVELTPPSPPRKINNGVRKYKENNKKIKKCCFSEKTCNTWSHLSLHQQQEILQGIMETVSQKFGLREQLDVIKIINPHAQLLPNDTEFFIDFNMIDDDKFNRLKQYVEQENTNRKISDDDQENMKKTKKTEDRKKGKSGKFDYKNKDEKLKRMERSKQRTVNRSKTTKQRQKERKSGLFAKEQVIAVETLTDGTCDGNEEIDILT